MIGRFADASNATLLVRLVRADDEPLSEIAVRLGRAIRPDDLDPAALAVYKPARGERPLWDFPDHTLHRREVAAYRVSRLLGWDLVPTTVMRADGPFGAGSLQRFVAHDPALHYFALVADAGPDVSAQLERMVLFDLLIDNADRKAGHVLLEQARRQDDGWHGHVRLVDHGVSFHTEDKLRTVAWDFAGQTVDLADRDDLARFAALLDDGVQVFDGLLDRHEQRRLAGRAERIAAVARFPSPTGDRPYPWPPI